jgi:hypothetical protein
MMTLYEDFGKPPSDTRDLSRESATALIQSLYRDKEDAALDYPDADEEASPTADKNGSPPTPIGKEPKSATAVTPPSRGGRTDRNKNINRRPIDLRSCPTTVRSTCTCYCTYCEGSL